MSPSKGSPVFKDGSASKKLIKDQLNLTETKLPDGGVKKEVRDEEKGGRGALGDKKKNQKARVSSKVHTKKLFWMVLTGWGPSQWARAMTREMRKEGQGSGSDHVAGGGAKGPPDLCVLSPFLLVSGAQPPRKREKD